jgi:transposase
MMPALSIARYFDFPRVKLTEHRFTDEGSIIRVLPDKRFVPVCARCGTPTRRIHSTKDRLIRDLNIAESRVWLQCAVRKLDCRSCGRFRVENLEFVEAGERITKRLARYVYDLCQRMPVTDVARHTGLDPKTVKTVDKRFLTEELGRIDFSGTHVLGVDEIAERKGHHYLTIVLNFETGQVLYVGKKRRARTLKKFFRMLSRRQRRGIRAVVIDMWDPYIKAIHHYCPAARIVFDLFHVKQMFSKAVCTVRNREYLHARRADQAVLKGTRYLLLSNRNNLSRKQVAHLECLLQLNQNLSTMHLLYEQLNVIWDQVTIASALDALDAWVRMAHESAIKEAIRFARTLQRYSYGILNHALYPIHTGKLEGINNRINVLKRRSYGYRDSEYFGLKIKQAFPGHQFN